MSVPAAAIRAPRDHRATAPEPSPYVLRGGAVVAIGIELGWDTADRQETSDG